MLKKKKNFLGLPPEYTEREAARIMIIPVPFDRTSTWKKGANHGPAAILEASTHLELYDIETDSEAYLAGIHTYPGKLRLSSSPKMVESVKKVVSECLNDNKFPIVLGGEHSVSIGAIDAAHAYHPDCGVLQLDAHTDLRLSYEGSRYNHACVMARAMEKGPVVQVGIRSMDSGEKALAERDRIFFARDIVERTDWVEQALDLLPEKIYITFDLDAFDPAFLPSTGTPEPGGLNWYQVTALLRAAFRRKTVIGCDVVELCPGPDHSSDFLAAKLVYKMISYYHYYQQERKG